MSRCWAVLFGLLGSVAGCQTTRSTFQAAAASPTPALERSGEQKPEVADTRQLLTNARVVDLEPRRDVPQESTWSRLWGLGQPKPLELPRTDLARKDVFEDQSPTQAMPDDF